MSRKRYSIMPLQNEQGAWVYLFRDDDMTDERRHGISVTSGVCCHYDEKKRNFTKTIDPIEAIEICGDLNDQYEKEMQTALESIKDQPVKNSIPPLRTGGFTGFFPFLFK